MDYRHEWKYAINEMDMHILRQRLSAIMQHDSHASNGTYEICSLYFDNISDKALREKIDGVNHREKFRIRYYNNDSSLIHLEKKSKVNGLCNKVSAVISANQAQAIVCGDYDWMRQSNLPLAVELYSKMISQGLRPKTIVEYTREPYIYAPGNVRVTLDYHIRTGIHGTDFLNPSRITIPAHDNPVILEVKWDAFLPDIIRYAIQLESRSLSAFSKYAACRVYG